MFQGCFKQDVGTDNIHNYAEDQKGECLEKEDERSAPQQDPICNALKKTNEMAENLRWHT